MEGGRHALDTLATPLVYMNDFVCVYNSDILVKISVRVYDKFIGV